MAFAVAVDAIAAIDSLALPIDVYATVTVAFLVVRLKMEFGCRQALRHRPPGFCRRRKVRGTSDRGTNGLHARITTGTRDMGSSSLLIIVEKA
jgi:hypothetical protein